MKIGRWHTLSKGRTLVTDIVTIANKIPLAPLLREFDLAELDTLRRKLRPRISWTVLFMKAYAVVAKRRPELRQIYTPFPFAHIYTHPKNIALVTITREVAGEPRLYFGRFRCPEDTSLTTLQKRYESLRRDPVETIRQFRHQDRLSSLPWLIRKPIWALLTNLWPSKRATNMGTFGMSISCFKSNLGMLHLGPTTTTIGCDLFPRKGKNRVTMTFDHRILDGKPAADVLEDLYQVITNEITAEIRELVAAAEAEQGDVVTAEQTTTTKSSLIPFPAVSAYSKEDAIKTRAENRKTDRRKAA